MGDSAIELERNFDSSAYTPVAGGERAVDRGSLALSPLADAPMSAPMDLASVLRLATKKQEAGQDREAQELFRQALEIAEATLEPDDPNVVLMLTDLTRLYLKNSAFQSAEPLLLRLIEIKRSKGDDHPEVATVLASLATVREALGQHESAEQLWRRVLDIRERTLAPNHFAIATALEHFGNSCAARGKIAEALNVLQRAVSIREKTMGVEHPSLRVSRERIADLRLQQSEESFELGGSSEVVIAPEKYRLLSGPSIPQAAPEPVSLTPLAPATKPRSTAPSQKKPPVILPGRFADRVWDTEETTTPLAVASEAAALTMILPNQSAPQPEAAPYLDTLESLRDEIERPYEHKTLSERSGEMISATMSFLGKKEAVVGMVAVAIGLLSLAVVTDSRGFGQGAQPAELSPVAARQPSNFSSTVATASILRSEPAAPTPAVADNSAKTVATHTRSPEDRAPAARKVPEKKIETKSLTLPALSTAVMSRLDSVASKAGTSSQLSDAMFAPSPAQVAVRRTSFGDGEAPAIPLRARLIGDLPTPRVPSQVADVEGEVRVRFSVDASGLPVMSTFEVVNSPNPLLTAAVKKVIPSMRFEPARAGGADPKPIADVVQIGFQFSRGR